MTRVRESARDRLLLFEHAIGVIEDSLFAVDATRHVVFVNSAFTETYGYPSAEIIGRDVGLVFGVPGDVETLDLTAHDVGARELLQRRRDGSTFPVSMHVSRLDDEPVITLIVTRDVTAQKKTESELREMRERYVLALEGANDGFFDWRLDTNHVEYSPRWLSMIGLERVDAETPMEWFKRVHAADLPNLQAQISAYLQGETAQLESEYRILHRDSVWRWMKVRAVGKRDANGKMVRLAGSQTDITHRRQAEAQLAHHAYHDSLTNLPNRALFMTRLEDSLKRAHQANHRFAVIFLDLDRFKVINDSLGHVAGDRLLHGIAERLRRTVRPSDFVARMGGDEFAVLFDGISGVEEVERVAERIQQALGQPFNIGGHEVFTTASIGIADHNATYESADDLLRDADTAMYRAKAMGRARYETFNSHMHDAALAQMRLESDLWKALENNEFEIYYQPLVALSSRRIVGVEALLRWNHPTRGLVPPNDFIPLAEETGLIVRIGEWVLTEACAQNRRWHLQGYPDLRVSVNVSARQFEAGRLPQFVRKALEDSGLPANRLSIEITETAAMQNLEVTIETLRELLSLGCDISLDDFGTGYSSLGCLQTFPVTTVKLDRAFVRNVTVDRQGAAISRAIITLAHHLQMHVVAEGVETQEELDFFSAEKCDCVQGYVFSRPLKVDALTEMLRHNHETQPTDDRKVTRFRSA